MLLTVTPLENPGPPSPVPPPTAPKPGKDNARLQRLLRKAAKKGGVQLPPTQSPKTFRSTLSPVNEGDMESPEPAVAQKQLLSPVSLPPRFQFRGVTHRVPSPYPKQHSFTFTLPEQQSLNQYLSPSPIPDTPSPRPSGFSTHDNPFLFPSGGNTSDHASLRVNANASPRPCTPRHVTFNPTPTTQPVVPLTPVPDIPAIIVPEPEPELDFQNRDNNIIEIQINPAIPNTESGHSTLKSPFPDHQRLTNISISCSTDSLKDNPATPQITAASETTNKTEILEVSRVAEISSNTSTLPSKPTDVNQTPALTTDGGPPLVAEIKTVSPPPPEVKSLPKPVKAKPAVTETDLSTSAKLPNSEEGNLLKSPERAKPPRKKPGGGWARLMKHLVVEPDEPTFPEPQKTEGKKEKTEDVKQADTEATQQSKGLRANKMWDALLYHMATKVPEKPAKEEGSKPDPASAPATPQLSFLRFRLPLLLHRPRFDARKLKEAAARPLRKVTAFFHRRITDKTSSTFNRTASGWSIKGEDAEQEKKEGEDAIEMRNE